MSQGFIKGRYWTPGEKWLLERKWKSDSPIEHLCLTLRRTKKAIWEYVRKREWHRDDEIDIPEPCQAPDTRKSRTCLACTKSFLSDGPGNRICDPCKRVQNLHRDIDDQMASVCDSAAEVLVGDLKWL